MDNGIIYLSINKINGKAYIGKTCQGLEKRKYQHQFESKFKRTKSIFHKALRKYNKDNFVWVVIGEGYNKYINDKEKRYIKLFNTTNSLFGYNITDGGEGQGSGKHNSQYNFELCNFYHISGKQELKITRHDFSVKYNLDKRVIAGLFSGRLRSYKGWVIYKHNIEKTRNMTLFKKYSFINNLGEEENDITQSEMCRKYNINVGNICQMILRNRPKTVNGWRLKQ